MSIVWKIYVWWVKNGDKKCLINMTLLLYIPKKILLYVSKTIRLNMGLFTPFYPQICSIGWPGPDSTRGWERESNMQKPYIEANMSRDWTGRNLFMALASPENIFENLDLNANILQSGIYVAINPQLWMQKLNEWGDIQSWWTLYWSLL